ncbi:Structural maintenance of chromosomes protein 6 [Homalodisca vitripennis]|nr:Structural maintenance of chromosomes protein 6 [Homalodisca vitripennis]
MRKVPEYIAEIYVFRRKAEVRKVLTHKAEMRKVFEWIAEIYVLNHNAEMRKVSEYIAEIYDLNHKAEMRKVLEYIAEIYVFRRKAEMRKESGEIKRELKQVQMYLQRLEEENGGSLQVLERNFKERHDQFNKINYELGELKSLLRKTKDALVKRRLKEHQLQISMSTSARHNFHMYLTERDFDGWLKFDFSEKTLNIIVRHQAETDLAVQTNTSSLSGGEKSFSTVAFIMAMWQEVKLPFHFLDEFDVFMDGINRRIVMDMLIEHAKETKQQFVFLTPLDMSSVSSSNIITIHRLEAPRD